MSRVIRLPGALLKDGLTAAVYDARVQSGDPIVTPGDTIALLE